MSTRPLVYEVINRSDRRVALRLSLAAAVQFLIEDGCAARWVRRSGSPVNAVYEDGRAEQADLEPFIEEVELSPEQIATITSEVDEYRAKSKRRFDEIATRLKPGEPFPRFSGQHWAHEGNRDEQIRVESDKLRVRWKDLWSV